MALSFAVIETAMAPLWDFGWFDLTRFKVDGPLSEREDWRRVFGDFLRDPLSRRSFCGPEPWGTPIERHGPFLHRRIAAEWFRPITAQMLSERIHAVLDDPRFRMPPEAGQRVPVEAWAAAVRTRHDDAFALDPPDQVEAKVDWDWVWTVYQEFASISRDRQELSIGVIGYD